jgi:ATP-dependent Clp endopeptidase proteolytic subunit ClpP
LNLQDKKKEKKEETEISLLSLTQSSDQEFRMTGVYGDLNEERASDALLSLLYLRQTSKKMVLQDPDDLESDLVEEIMPIDFYVSTFGGSSAEMFCLHDAMRMIRETCPIRTIGLGKVMSAGVLLLASGTKGERSIGANCRVMIHGVMSGQQGSIIDMENEMQETKFTQKQYVKALAAETNMSEQYIRKLIRSKRNVYFNAERALELGIVDKII